MRKRLKIVRRKIGDYKRTEVEEEEEHGEEEYRGEG